MLETLCLGLRLRLKWQNPMYCSGELFSKQLILYIFIRSITGTPSSGGPHLRRCVVHGEWARSVAGVFYEVGSLGGLPRKRVTLAIWGQGSYRGQGVRHLLGRLSVHSWAVQTVDCSRRLVLLWDWLYCPWLFE